VTEDSDDNRDVGDVPDPPVHRYERTFVSRPSEARRALKRRNDDLWGFRSATWTPKD